ncbi:hypothetical protein QYE76_019670 [Lolium multiflorum]|uniref:Nuclease HARBI1 n=1 Tax=Lolium multiflorum TaxID=4521 RepID=A0AAD8R3G3_LOLMU|nr:hypothetical protein QYE76_019670 [Lolium multiflorum]
MDSDTEEMLAELFDEEDQSAIDEKEHLLILACLAGLLANEAGPQRVGSTRGRRKSKPRQHLPKWATFSRFAVVRYPAMTWSKSNMWEVMQCCVILHNMIIESERDHPVPDSEASTPYYRQGPLAEVDHQVPASWTAFLTTRREIRDAATHQALQNDLVQHLWARKGNGNADNDDANA